MMTTESEVWLSVIGYDGLYEVSSLGRVRSLDRVVHKKDGSLQKYPGMTLKPIPKSDKDDRPTVRLWKYNSVKSVGIHKLVSLAFNGETPKGLVIRHSDGNKHNNRVDNLEFGTHSENAFDKVQHGQHHMANRNSCPYGHKLVEGNLTGASKNKKQRSCLACSRGQSNAKYRGTDPIVESNRHYEIIMSGLNGVQ